MRLKNQAGISLLEMLVVLSILSLSLLIIAPNFKGPLNRLTFEAESNQLQTTLETARSQAIRKNESIDVVINVAAKTYRNNLYPTSHALPQDIDITIEAAASDVVDNEAIITFYPDGSAKGAEIEMTRGNQSYVISVDWLLGDITMEQRRGAP